MASPTSNLKVLIVGQTPPPFGGQAVMIRILLDGVYANVTLYHVRMEFSRDLGATGKWQFAKLWSLVEVIAEIYRAKLKYRPDVLYYPPSGPTLLAVARDIAILGATRFLFRKTVFHFHASGLSDYRSTLNPVFGTIFDLALKYPDVAIRISESAPPEGPRLGARTEFIVPNGIEDVAGTLISREKTSAAVVRILFVALLTESKGVLVAVEAVNTLLRDGANVECVCMGGWESEGLREKAMSLIDGDFKHLFSFPGILTGEQKWDEYRKADIFCFPSFFHSETFPVVLLEAMCFSLPIVTTRWRGIPDVVKEGENALVTIPRDVRSCEDALHKLVSNAEQRAQMGRASRARFLDHFTVAAHREGMQQVFDYLKASVAIR